MGKNGEKSNRTKAVTNAESMAMTKPRNKRRPRFPVLWFNSSSEEEGDGIRDSRSRFGKSGWEEYPFLEKLADILPLDPFYVLDVTIGYAGKTACVH